MSRPDYVVSVPAGHPDAALIALCNSAGAARRSEDLLWQRIDEQPNPTAAWGNFHATVSEWASLSDTIRRTPAKTPEGIRAKAEVVALITEDPETLSLLSDILGRQVSIVKPGEIP